LPAPVTTVQINRGLSLWLDEKWGSRQQQRRDHRPLKILQIETRHDQSPFAERLNHTSQRSRIPFMAVHYDRRATPLLATIGRRDGIAKLANVEGQTGTCAIGDHLPRRVKHELDCGHPVSDRKSTGYICR